MHESAEVNPCRRLRRFLGGDDRIEQSQVRYVVKQRVFIVCIAIDIRVSFTE
jgi:hypothetical protein